MEELTVAAENSSAVWICGRAEESGKKSDIRLILRFCLNASK